MLGFCTVRRINNNFSVFEYNILIKTERSHVERALTMRDIRLTYYDTDIRLSTYLLNFFRIVGIYADERIITELEDEEQIEDKELEFLGINIVIVCPEMNYDEFSYYDIFDENIYLLKEEDNIQIEDNEGIILFSEKEDELKTLKNLISKLAERDEIFEDEEEALIELAGIYERHSLKEAMLGTRFSVPHEKNFKLFCKKYMKAIDDIYTITEYEYSNFAKFSIAYLAYEYNYYCKRLKRGFWYDVDSILSYIDDLQDEADEEWISLDLLFAQIYGDLRKDIDHAFEYYSDVVEISDYNALAWYKMGTMIEKKYEDYNTAIEYYESAIEINPYYIPALYKNALCCFKMGELSEARNLYINLSDVLDKRQEQKILRPKEIWYLFQTYVHLAEIEWVQYGDAGFSLYWYEEAEQLWNNIISEDGDDFYTHFVEEMYGNNDGKLLISFENLKSCLDLKMIEVYERIIALNEYLENTEVVTQYKSKLDYIRKGVEI